MTAGLVKHWLESGRLELPLPASGRTAERWQRLAELAAENIVAARVAEAHVDAVAILHELGGKPPEPGQLWSVWAAEAPDAVLTATDIRGAYLLNGTKVWCPGAGFCTHALVTARRDDGTPGLFAVTVTDPTVKALPSTWWNAGMAGSDTRPVQFTNTHAVAVGDPGDYLIRPGFWHGAIGVAACWLGGARRVADPLYRCAASQSADAYSLAHMGAVDAALAAGDAMLAAAAAQVDADPFDRAGTAQLLARRVRTVVEHAVDEAITRTGRALGPGPLCQDGRHAQRVADLSIYIRQSHAERDLAELGRLAGRRAVRAP
ncbi:acyl-CoA dehydrogenase [Mycobacterium avium subsp. hominissuis]|uniref:Acyl-CoA dehydrogenase n=1 Tax=Mycobacterium avium TaxID=1764 RepID=A0A2A2ZEJ4_MYCAV|nr:acyl-CoA dehydrogenase [Mycobacterium avium]ATO63973.2 acyl-CoA dehydrogenase [Mycobacterium avium subsp. hominissuis]ATO68527.1 acyl-CoA dehydrogenase [Mycobacterium avium subsp. hominissuis]ATO73067.1 acyl-CoA dehydrogenase [Mycobacterium avium subsp. hominissuis]ETZ44546.1 acyl-CoA dehydrogenase, middle domain protein [Mycobacterium avium MAV_120709_2344]MCA4736692.1 acyl-CoA dehydrogenase [Mycobacterium avium subsp. hominissuis]